MVKDIRIEMKPRNNLILTRMEELGIATVAELCRRIGANTSQPLVGAIINLKETPFDKRSNPLTPKWRVSVLKIAETLGADPEELFPEALREARIDPKTKLFMEVSLDEIKRLGGGVSEYLLIEASQERDMEKQEIVEALRSALHKLTHREEKVVSMSFGLDCEREYTLEEIAKALNLGGRSRAHQIRGVAMRKLRHPCNTRPLKEAGVEKFLG